jgi:hypothetical protein
MYYVLLLSNFFPIVCANMICARCVPDSMYCNCQRRDMRDIYDTIYYYYYVVIVKKFKIIIGCHLVSHPPAALLMLTNQGGGG